MELRINETKYGEKNNPKLTGAYAKLNSYILSEVCGLLKAKFNKDGKYGTGKEWRIRIEERQYTSKPYYLLDFGEGYMPIARGDDPLIVNCISFHSHAQDAINWGSSYIKIYAWGNFGDYTPTFIKKYLAYIYQQGVKKYFPEHFFTVDEEAYQ